MKKILLSTLMLSITVTCAFAAKPKNQPTVNADSLAIEQRKQEIRDSLNTIMDKAKAGDAAAMNDVGLWYYQGKHVPQNYNTAYEWWKKASLKSNVQATANLGLCYQFGHGVEKDSVDAIRLYEKSIKDGNQVLLKSRTEQADKSSFDAMLVGDCYEKGVGVTKNLGKAAEYYAKAAKLGSVDGMRQAGMCHLNSKDNGSAFKYFEQGASKGDVTCEFWSGKMLLGDMNIPANKPQAVVYLMKAADKGMPAAQNELGTLYAEGNGVTKNLAEAAKWFEKAAIGGNAKAMFNYAIALKDGTGINQDYDAALFWMGEAADNGHQRSFNRLIHQLDSVGDPFADYVKGMKFYIIDRNLNDANECFKKVEKAKIPEGAIMQSVILASSHNPKPNAKKAAQNLEKLAPTNAEAAFYLASLYEAGNGVPQDMNKAISLYRQAADMGYGKAQCYLADIYFEGRGTDKDILTAVALYQKALDGHQLSKNGYIRLADCYENGLGGLATDKKKAETLRSHKPSGGVTALLKGLK